MKCQKNLKSVIFNERKILMKNNYSLELFREINRFNNNSNELNLEQIFIKTLDKATKKQISIQQNFNSILKLFQIIVQSSNYSIYGGNIFKSCLFGNYDGVKWFIEKKNISKNIKIEKTDKANNFCKDDTLIHVACANGHLEIVKYLIEKQDVDIEIKGFNERTPLHCACENGHLPIIEYLISKGANINSLDKHSNSILHYASSKGHLPIVKYLVEKQNIDYDILNSKGENPFSCAKNNNNLEIVQYLLQKYPLELNKNKYNDSDFKILLMGISDAGKSTIFRQLQLKYDDLKKKNVNSLIHAIRCNVISDLKTVIKYIQENSINLGENMGVYYDVLQCIDEVDSFYSEEEVKIINYICHHHEIIELLNCDDLNSINGNDEYFFQNTERIFHDDYEPNHKDILMSKFRNIGEFHILLQKKCSKLPMRIFNINEIDKKTLKRVFQNVSGVLFVVPLNDFDKTRKDDNESKLILQISLEVFQMILESSLFKDTHIFLIFNKYSLFKSKIEQTDKFAKFYPSYLDDFHDAEKCAKFIKDQFFDIMHKFNREDISFTIDAIDTDQVINTIDQIYNICNKYI